MIIRGMPQVAEVEIIYDMFDPVLFSVSRLQTIKTMLGDNL